MAATTFETASSAARSRAGCARAWTESGTTGCQSTRGTATFVVAPDGRSCAASISARARKALPEPGTSRRRAAPSSDRAANRPARGLAEELQHDGRVVLYGIHFDSGSDVPRPDSEPTLQRILEALQGDASLKLQIEGHTDSTNTDAYNQALSERRAKAVVQWLTAKGIAPVRLQAKGFGRMRPVAGNETAQGPRSNRRVELLRID